MKSNLRCVISIISNWLPCVFHHKTLTGVHVLVFQEQKKDMHQAEVFSLYDCLQSFFHWGEGVLALVMLLPILN